MCRGRTATVLEQQIKGLRWNLGSRGMAKNKGWQKRHAIQIASQLPENVEDALAVLNYARFLVTDFLGADKDALAEGRASATVKAFPASANSR